MTTPEIHPEIAHLAWLLGTWAGEGAGEYPTIEDFRYSEHVTFAHVGKPFFAYNQKTKHEETGLPLHAEAGYLRPVGLDRVELLNVQPSGIMEIYEGTVDGTTLDLVAVQVATSATAKDVTEVTRRITVDPEGETLSYRMQMAAVGEPLQHHLAATLHKQQ
ncbi:MAG: FABP family protein [Acidimicrobiales bacterium]|nr:FABP family protein [Acidimicrobiales bacterium]RZV48597.1 MAG: FABP family protein [Acidimicrobiales bacterium]